MKPLGNPLLAADALISTARSFPEPGAFRVKFVDLLQIYWGRPAYVAVWIDGARVVASQTDQDIQSFAKLRTSGHQPTPRYRLGGSQNDRPAAGVSFWSLPNGTKLDAVIRQLMQTLTRSDEPLASAWVLDHLTSNGRGRAPERPAPPQG